VGSGRASASEVPARPARRSASRRSAPGLRWDSLRPANGLSVERSADRVRFLEHIASVLSAMDPARRVLPALERGPARVRRARGNRLGLAEPGWGEDEGSTGRGKEQGPIPRIEADPGPGVPFLRMEAAFPWPWPWPCRAPKRMTRFVEPTPGSDDSRSDGMKKAANYEAMLHILYGHHSSGGRGLGIGSQRRSIPENLALGSRLRCRATSRRRADN